MIEANEGMLLMRFCTFLKDMHGWLELESGIQAPLPKLTGQLGGQVFTNSTAMRVAFSVDKLLYPG